MKTPFAAKSHKGFTLVEIMIVVAIIALLAAIAVPGFLRARKRSQASKILNDLRMIDGAVDQYAIETARKTGDVVGVADWTTISRKAPCFITPETVCSAPRTALRPSTPFRRYRRPITPCCPMSRTPDFGRLTDRKFGNLANPKALFTPTGFSARREFILTVRRAFCSIRIRHESTINAGSFGRTSATGSPMGN